MYQLQYFKIISEICNNKWDQPLVYKNVNYYSKLILSFVEVYVFILKNKFFW